jgi:aspartate-semialdehyde dehydrogenase
MSKSHRVAIVGASGAVGVEMLRVMERRNFPVASLRLLASPRSAGKPMEFRGETFHVEPLTLDAFRDIDIALFSAGGAISRDYAQAAVDSGAVVVDNSSAFRMVPEVPLVVPENHRGIIANPNCTTAITLMALHPLHRAFGVKRIFASTYQAVSGAGARAIDELRSQTAAVAKGEPVQKEIFPHQIAFNVIPQVDAFLDTGYTKEEMKMQNEGRRIMHLPAFTASVTCVRVPVYRAHSVALSAEFEREVTVDAAIHALQHAPGLQYVAHGYPMPLDCAGQDDCFAGRVRRDCAMENGLALWVCGDQLLKGAALNAVQIAELL